MENIDKYADFAPFILVVLVFIWQHNLFVKPEQLEKKHREILEEMETRFVTWTVFNTVIDGLKQQLNRVDSNVEKLCNLFIDGEKKQ